jgi:hypothetical protein
VNVGGEQVHVAADGVTRVEVAEHEGGVVGAEDRKDTPPILQPGSRFLHPGAGGRLRTWATGRGRRDGRGFAGLALGDGDGRGERELEALALEEGLEGGLLLGGVQQFEGVRDGRPAEEEQGEGAVGGEQVLDVVEEVGRAGPVDGVGDVVAVAVEAAGGVGHVDGDGGVELGGVEVDGLEGLAGLADERRAASVLPIARILSDHEERGAGWEGCEGVRQSVESDADVAGSLVERAEGAAGAMGGELGKGDGVGEGAVLHSHASWKGTGTRENSK